MSSIPPYPFARPKHDPELSAHPRRCPGQAQHAVAEAASSARTSTANPADPSSNSNSNSSASSIKAARVVLEALAVTRAGIISMREALSRMPVGCHPLIFYQRVRPFLSGWKANPTLPDGVLYEVLGVLRGCVGRKKREGKFGRVCGETRGKGGWDGMVFLLALREH